MPSSPSRLTLDLVWERAFSRCERCGLWLSRGEGGYSVHHRRLKSLRLPDTDRPGNLLLLCGDGVSGCHGVVHHNRAEAASEGFIVSRYADPLEVRVASWRQGWVRLDHDGGATLAPDPELD